MWNARSGDPAARPTAGWPASRPGGDACVRLGGGTGGGRPAQAAAATATAPGHAARRQGVRCFDPAPCAAGSRHRPTDRAAGDRLERAAGPAPLGGCLIATLLVNPFPLARGFARSLAASPPDRGCFRGRPSSAAAPCASGRGPAMSSARSGRPAARPTAGWPASRPGGDACVRLAFGGTGGPDPLRPPRGQRRAARPATACPPSTWRAARPRSCAPPRRPRA